MDIKTLQRVSKHLKEAAQILKKADRLREEPGAYPEFLDESRRLRRIVEGLPLEVIQGDLVNAADGIESELDDLYQEFRTTFGRELDEALKAHNLHLLGQFPEFRCGMLTILVDPKKSRARIQFGPEVIRQEKPVPQVMADTIRDVHKQVFARAHVNEVYLKALFNSYTRTCRYLGKISGERVPILRVLLDLNMVRQSDAFRADPSNQTFKPYGRTAFAFDLYRLKRSGKLTQEGRHLVLHTAVYEETKKRTDHLWVPDDGDGNGTRIAAISFRKEIL
jgi:hypothetical protein